MSRSKQDGDSVDVKPKIKLKQKQEVMHHLFKAEVADMMKNVAFKPGVVELKKTEHCHWFHSVNSLGIPEQYTPEVGGHFHKIEWRIDEKGNLLATCGPALKRVGKRGRDGRIITKIVPVSWIDKFAFEGQDEDEQVKDKVIVDNHTHKMTYYNSEVISATSIKQVVQQPVFVPPQPDGMTVTERDR